MTLKLYLHAPSYHVPKHIQEHVDYITPGIRLLSATKRGSRKRGFGITSGRNGHAGTRPPTKTLPGYFPWSEEGELATCDKAITPACRYALTKQRRMY